MSFIRFILFAPFALAAVFSPLLQDHLPPSYEDNFHQEEARDFSTHRISMMNSIPGINGKSRVAIIDSALGDRCGPGVGNCDEGLCCSPAGYCGSTSAHCRSPECQLDYGTCDGSKTPEGLPTIDIPRLHNSKVPYGKKIYSCTVPRTLALTFDDGPNVHTSYLLDLLDSFDAKATFFITGVNSGKGQIDDFSRPWGSLIQRMHRSGHQIASHSWSHQDLSKVTPAQRKDEMVKNEAAIRNILGGIPVYMRPPYSSCENDSGCVRDMNVLGYHMVYFNIDTDDYNNDDPNLIQRSKDIFDKAISTQDPPGQPFLAIAHDIHAQTVYNLTAHILQRTADAGYRAVTVGECLDDPKEFWYRWDHRSVRPGRRS